MVKFAKNWLEAYQPPSAVKGVDG